MNGKTVTISENLVRQCGGLVILPREEYCRLLSIPTYQLKGKAARALDKLVQGGQKAYRAGQTKILKSLADLD